MKNCFGIFPNHVLDLTNKFTFLIEKSIVLEIKSFICLDISISSITTNETSAATGKIIDKENFREFVIKNEM
jgi:hypothetical protein